MNDVAKLAGVSLKTVSNFFNGYPYMRDETRARIERAVADLDYRVNASARSLRAGRSDMVGLIVPELDQAYFAEFAQEVIGAADAVGLTVLVETTGGSREREQEALSGASRQLLDGAIYHPIALGPDDVADLGRAFPVVVVGERYFEGLADHVLIADVEVAHRAMRHLLDTGRRRILILGAATGPASRTAALRLRGCEQALREAGLELDDSLVVAAGPWHRESGAAAVGRALAGGVEFDAVFGFNDALALGAQWALQQGGVEVPGAVSVVGIDDTEDARFAHPPLTSMSPGRTQIAQRAVELLAARIRDPRPAEGFTTVVADYELRVRESSAHRVETTHPDQNGEHR